MMTKKPNLILCLNKKDLESKIISRKIKNIVTKYKLNIHIKEIDYLSQEAIELSVKCNINSFPFAVFDYKAFVFSDFKHDEEQLLKFLT